MAGSLVEIIKQLLSQRKSCGEVLSALCQLADHTGEDQAVQWIQDIPVQQAKQTFRRKKCGLDQMGIAVF